MFQRLSVNEWLSLDRDMRKQLRELFSIPQSTYSHVSGGIVLSDGSTYEDLAAITIEKLEEYTGEKGDFKTLFIKTLEKLNSLDNQNVYGKLNEEAETTSTQSETKRRGRPKKEDRQESVVSDTSEIKSDN